MASTKCKHTKVSFDQLHHQWWGWIFEDGEQTHVDEGMAEPIDTYEVTCLLCGLNRRYTSATMPKWVRELRDKANNVGMRKPPPIDNAAFYNFDNDEDGEESYLGASTLARLRDAHLYTDEEETEGDEDESAVTD